jgi:hypothetical protein
LRSDRSTIDTLEIFGSQAALTIENHQRHEELIEKTQEVTIELDRLRNTLQIVQDQPLSLLQKNNDEAGNVRLLRKTE